MKWLQDHQSSSRFLLSFKTTAASLSALTIKLSDCLFVYPRLWNHRPTTHLQFNYQYHIQTHLPLTWLISCITSKIWTRYFPSSACQVWNYYNWWCISMVDPTDKDTEHIKINEDQGVTMAFLPNRGSVTHPLRQQGKYKNLSFSTKFWIFPIRNAFYPSISPQQKLGYIPPVWMGTKFDSWLQSWYVLRLHSHLIQVRYVLLTQMLVK